MKFSKLCTLVIAGALCLSTICPAVCGSSTAHASGTFTFSTPAPSSSATTNSGWQCSSCNASNPSGTKFCGQCGKQKSSSSSSGKTSSGNQNKKGSYLGDYYIANVDSWVSMRRYPDTDSERVTKVSLGKKVSVYEGTSGFYYCVYNGYEGYISTKYLSKSKPSTGSGSSSKSSSDIDPYDLSGYGYRTVRSNGRGSLIFQKKPGGSFMKSYKYYDGDTIYVNLKYRKKYHKLKYTMAYENGVYGYVDASYIDW